MVIIANFVQQKQYDIMTNLINKYQIQNMEIVPLLGDVIDLSGRNLLVDQLDEFQHHDDSLK